MRYIENWLMDLSESNTIDHHKDDKKCECNKCSVKCVSSLNTKETWLTDYVPKSQTLRLITRQSG